MTPRLLDKAPVAGAFQHKVFGMSVDKDIMFSNHRGRQRSGIAKRQRKLVTKVSFLRSFLEPDEIILLVTTGHSPPTVLEKFGIGWLFLYLKRSILVFTDRRVFHVPTTPIYTYRQSIAQIPYAACKSIKMKGGNMVVQYKGGEEVEKFISISGKEKKKIRELLKIITFNGAQTKIPRRVHMCPKCGMRLFDLVTECRHCGLEFKKGNVASFLAAFLPGGGYFYLRQPFLGAAEAILEIGAYMLIGFSIINLIGGGPGFTTNLMWLGLGTLMLGLLKPVAVVHSKVMADEFVPGQSDIRYQA